MRAFGITPGQAAPPASVGRARLSGCVAAAVSLSVTELVAAGAGPSLVDSIGTEFINRFAAPLAEIAIEIFGTNDKLALRVGIIVTSLLIGSALGAASTRRPSAGPIGFAVFGLVGVIAAMVDPLASQTRSVVAGVVGAAAGAVVFTRLLRLAAPLVSPPSSNDDPTIVAPSRRSFLVGATLAGAGALVAAGTAQTLRSGAEASVRAIRRLPRPVRRVAPPASQPFAVPGLSDYITPTDDFYRIDTALFIPRVNASRWTLTVDGMVKRPLTITYDELLAMDMVEEPITMQCVSNEVGGQLVGTATWLGVPLGDLLDRAGLEPGATQVVGRSVDRFTVGFPTDVALDGRSALVAVGMNGEPLRQRHGYPARLIVAGLYGYVSATKWLRQIELTRLEDFDAYWIPRGWAKEAPIKIASRVDVPKTNARLDAGPQPIAGVAWAPHVGIEKVEVRIDDGPWRTARLGDVASENTWVQWMLPWDATRGRHRIQVRATDANGTMQIEEENPPRPDGATGYHGVTVAVS